MPPEELSSSLRDALSASFDADVSGSSATSAADSSPAPAPAAGTEGAAPAAGGDRARDPSGRFAPGSGDRPADGGQAQAPAGEPSAPDGFDADTWAVLTPEARASLSGWAGKQRETLAEREKRLAGYEPIERVLQSRRDVLTAQYGGVDKAMEQLFHLSDFAGRDPGGFIRYLAQQRGLDLGQLVGQAQAPAQRGQDPRQAAQDDPRSMVAALVREQLTEAEVDRSYREFMTSSAYEYRDNPGVKRVMAALLASGEASDYATAYDMASHAHPDIGPKRRAAEAAAQAQASSARRAEAANAKASAAVTVTGAPGTARPPAGGAAPSSVRAALLSAMDREAGGRV